MNHHFSYYQQRLRLRKNDEVVVDKMLDFINYGGAAMIFGQLVSDGPFRWFSFLLGVFLVIVAYGSVWYYLSRFN
ncbi:hypothetical protein HN748_03755 [Candidatus Peregrinibacteria bacterium]|jgi:hypothetical protein|nr:hypothetical protein [Candidatus Peregrinibacteria bacterium]MBT7484129.1 hypothetical protein [Candidatus Peregrinibacteria bacterium]MBT7703324.1 hypothetical protein [Candidatus Peregrinibacteria bacterium]